MNDDKVNEMFNQIAGAEAVGEVVGVIHTIYDTAMKKGFPEERAWALSQDMLNKLWVAVEPMIKEFVKREMP